MVVGLPGSGIHDLYSTSRQSLEGMELDISCRQSRPGTLRRRERKANCKIPYKRSRGNIYKPALLTLLSGIWACKHNNQCFASSPRRKSLSEKGQHGQTGRLVTDHGCPNAQPDSGRAIRRRQKNQHVKCTDSTSLFQRAKKKRRLQSMKTENETAYIQIIDQPGKSPSRGKNGSISIHKPGLAEHNGESPG